MTSSCGTIGWTSRFILWAHSVSEKKSLTGKTAVRDFSWRFQDLKSLGFRSGCWWSRYVSLLFCSGSSWSGFGCWCSRCGCCSGMAAWLRSGLAAGANDQAAAWLWFSGFAAGLGFCFAAGLGFTGRSRCWCGSSFAGRSRSSGAAAFLCGTAATGFSRAGEHKCCQQSQQCHVTHCEILF